MKKLKIIKIFFITLLTVLLTNCSFYLDKINIIESVQIINLGNMISNQNIVFQLHLENKIEQLTFIEAQNLKNEYSGTINKYLKNSLNGILATINKAQTDTNEVKITFVSQEKDWSDNNVVIYVPIKQGYLILTSTEEINKAFYTTNPFNINENYLISTDYRLAEAKEQNKEIGEFYNNYIEKKSIDQALKIMENELRKLHAEEKGALLTNAYSPKINNALKDIEIQNKIKNSNDSKVIWAYKFLLEKHIITNN